MVGLTFVSDLIVDSDSCFEANVFAASGTIVSTFVTVFSGCFSMKVVVVGLVVVSTFAIVCGGCVVVEIVVVVRRVVSTFTVVLGSCCVEIGIDMVGTKKGAFGDLVRLRNASLSLVVPSSNNT